MRLDRSRRGSPWRRCGVPPQTAACQRLTASLFPSPLRSQPSEEALLGTPGPSWRAGRGASGAGERPPGLAPVAAGALPARAPALEGRRAPAPPRVPPARCGAARPAPGRYWIVSPELSVAPRRRSRSRGRGRGAHEATRRVGPQVEFTPRDSGPRSRRGTPPRARAPPRGPAPPGRLREPRSSRSSLRGCHAAHAEARARRSPRDLDVSRKRRTARVSVCVTPLRWQASRSSSPCPPAVRKPP